MLTKLYPAKIENDALQAPKTHMSDADSFLDKTAHVNDQQQGRLILALDATRGRQTVWDLVLGIQPGMFVSAGQKTGLSLQLVYFRGSDECRVSKWTSNPQAMLHMMSQIKCEGEVTQLSRVLTHAGKEHGKKRISAMIYIGDRMAEDRDALLDQALELGKQGLKTIMIQDGIDSETEKTFRAISETTNGAFLQFDPRYPQTLEDALPASAILATGGIRGLGLRTDETSKHLLEQLK